MKNHFLFALLLILCVPYSYAQQNLPPNVSITWGPLSVQPASTNKMQLVAFDKDNIYVMRNKFEGFGSSWRSMVWLMRYNDSLQLAETGALPEKGEQQDKRAVVEILNFANKTYLFSTSHDNETNITHHYVQTIDLKSLKLNNDVKKIGEKAIVRQKVFFVITGKKLNEMMTDYDFKYRVSPDRTKLMVLTKQRAIKDTPQQYTLQVFDGDLNLLWTKDLQMKDENTFLLNLQLDNEANAYTMIRSYKDAREKESDEPLCSHTVIGYFDQGNTRKTYPIQEEGEFTYDADMYLLGEGKVLINSFFIDNKYLKEKSKNKKAFPRGFVMTTIDLKNEKEIKEGFTELDSIRGLLIGRGVVRREDGGFIAIAQDYYDSIPKASFAIPGEASHVREDLIVIGVGSSHKVEWRTRIGRQSLTSYFTANMFDSYNTTSPSSMIPFIYKDKLYVIFNGLITQNHEEQKKKLTNKKALWMVSVDANGKAESYVLASDHNCDVLIDASRCFSPEENELILLGESDHGTANRFIRLRFE